MHGGEEIQGCRSILKFSLLNDRNCVSFSPASSLTPCVEPPFITVHHQSEWTSSSRQNMSLVKEGGVAKPIRLKLEMAFWNLVWQAQAPLPPRSFQGSCSGFQRLCAAIPQLWAGWDQFEMSGCMSCHWRGLQALAGEEDEGSIQWLSMRKKHPAVPGSNWLWAALPWCEMLL